MNRGTQYRISARNRWRGFVTEDDIAILQTSTSYLNKKKAIEDMKRAQRILNAEGDNKVQAFIRRLLRW